MHRVRVTQKMTHGHMFSNTALEHITAPLLCGGAAREFLGASCRLPSHAGGCGSAWGPLSPGFLDVFAGMTRL